MSFLRVSMRIYVRKENRAEQRIPEYFFYISLLFIIYRFDDDDDDNNNKTNDQCHKRTITTQTQ